jgi:O-antigen/teichoic acid export membrane protein
MFVAIVLAGPLVIRIWTHGIIHAPYALIVLMAATMVVNGIWLPISNLIFALNRHALFSYWYLASAAVSVLLTYPLVRWIGPPGAGVSLLLLDGNMLIRVWSVAVRIKVFDPRALQQVGRRELRGLLSKYVGRKIANSSHAEPPPPL